jgi:hypothetical protein
LHTLSTLCPIDFELRLSFGRRAPRAAPLKSAAATPTLLSMRAQFENESTPVFHQHFYFYQEYLQ